LRLLRLDTDMGHLARAIDGRQHGFVKSPNRSASRRWMSARDKVVLPHQGTLQSASRSLSVRTDSEARQRLVLGDR
jgi:hypothetical protein